ncbi:TetR-like C-terminal domain-containing protein [Dactylosporangium sp. NPDC048998]|uniref:TetR-like C-terminal domain-containing protein n=1 Tax=Dactylosporangium sp. NPDC048998 TaxID=3363976 RepID=UPI00371D6085
MTSDVQTRRRGEALQQAIFEAVFEQLGKVGYGRLTMEGVAAAARTGKAALYRRWPDKNALIVDALRAAMPSTADVPSTGELRADILALLMRMRDALESSYGATFQVLKAEPGPGASLVHAAVRDRVFAPYRRLVGDALRAGVQRGEVRPEVTATEESTVLAANVGPAMLIHRHFLEGPDLPDDFIIAVVDGVVLPMLRAR